MELLEANSSTCTLTPIRRKSQPPLSFCSWRKNKKPRARQKLLPMRFRDDDASLFLSGCYFDAVRNNSRSTCGRPIRLHSPDPLIEASRGATRNGDRRPVVAREYPGNEHDLPHVIAAVGQRPLHGQWHRMRLTPDRDCPQEV